MTHHLTSETWGAFWVCFVIAAAASSISITITQTEVFAPWRRFTEKLGHMIWYLFQCFYCVKHWVIFLGIAIYQPIIIQSGHRLVDLVVSAFFTVTLSTLISGIMFRAFVGAMEKKVKEAEMKARMPPKAVKKP